MADPGKPVPAEVHYELCMLEGPRTIQFRGEPIDIGYQDQLPVIEQVVVQGGSIISRTVVAVVGDERLNDMKSLLGLRRFLNSGGIIGLGRNMF
jgi:hypothetical protein